MTDAHKSGYSTCVMEHRYSIIIPAYNEEGAIGKVLEELLKGEPREAFEVIVVDDCSKDRTAAEAAKYPVRVFSNVQNFGYGYSLKRGIREATNDHIIIMDADGSYPVHELSKLIGEYEKGFDMVVGARQGHHYRGSRVKQIARFFFKLLSEFSTGRRIPDINSGCRVFRKDLALRFFHTLSSGFSFTTTITLAFMLNAYSVSYLPIEYHKRTGKSKVHYVRDTLRSAQIIVEAITFYNPLKIFLLCAWAVFLAMILSIIVAFWSVWIALFILVGVGISMSIFSIGLIAVLIKFVYDERKRNENRASGK